MTLPALLACGFRTAILLLALAASGCTTTTDGTTTTVAVRRPGTLPGVAQLTPSTPGGPPPSGTFNGTGRLSASAGSGCRPEVRMAGMTVTGSRVRYQGFRGTIQPDGFIQMQAGERFLYGAFDGDRFVGHLWQPKPACTYDVVMTHAG
jgi:hypothetical protein